MSSATALITSPDGQQRRVVVGADGLRIGRAPDNDLVILAAGVAPYHAVIRSAGQYRTRQVGHAEPADGPLLIEVPTGGGAGAAVRIGGYTIRLTGPAGPLAA
ncbi:MAG: Inner rane component of cytoplasmic domain [Chloroflexota bacterium]|jgi:hypothetical protein